MASGICGYFLVKTPSWRKQVGGQHAIDFDVGLRRVKVTVAGDDEPVPQPAQGREQRVLSRPALVEDEDIGRAGQVVKAGLPKGLPDLITQEEIPPVRAVGLIAEMQGRPLLVGHRCGPRIGEQVAASDHLRRKIKHVQANDFQHLRSLCHREHLLQCNRMVEIRPRPQSQGLLWGEVAEHMCEGHRSSRVR